MKVCPKCKIEKDEYMFGVCRSRRDGLQPYCKQCNIEYQNKRQADDPESFKEYQRRYYRENRDSRLRYIKGRIDERAEFLRGVKESNGCKQCGITDHRVLHFHHRDPSQKSFNIASGSSRSLSKLQQEIEKCDILCANCHAILHYKQERDGTLKVNRGAPRTF